MRILHCINCTRGSPCTSLRAIIRCSPHPTEEIIIPSTSSRSTRSNKRKENARRPNTLVVAAGPRPLDSGLSVGRSWKDQKGQKGK
jgi:hypothetical protein